ncbi:MAG: MmcQ/YjbR family DNA-binding protein [Chthoniobacterales bacterium]|jgi:predicted DNA-binding protein (MmcQ/YjbR family)
MTADQFRRLALDLPEAAESSHVAHPDFRFRNKIFATLGYPDSHWGMVKLTPEQQTELIRSAWEAFRPAAGAWGRGGSTIVLLAAVTSSELRPILRRAYENVAAKDKMRRAKGRSRVRNGAAKH